MWHSLCLSQWTHPQVLLMDSGYCISSKPTAMLTYLCKIDFSPSTLVPKALTCVVYDKQFTVIE